MSVPDRRGVGACRGCKLASHPTTADVKNLFDKPVASEIRGRVAALTAANSRQWGTMTPAQAMAHCAIGLEIALGDQHPPRMMIGRLLGPVIKRLALGDDAPMRRNSPTVPGMVVRDDRQLESERARLIAAIDRFAAAGRPGCTTHPHSFFGRLDADEWGVLMYKHLDHHLRQFGA